MKKILFTLFVTLLFASCKKDAPCCDSELEKLLIQQRNGLPSAIQILDMLEQPTDGYIWLKSYNGPANERPATQCSGFINGPWEVDFTASTLQFGGISTTMPANRVHYTDFIDNEYQYENIYGTNANVRITLLNGGEQPVLNANFYVPKHIQLTNYTFQLHQKPTYESGVSISWAADAANTYGIGIAVVYEAQNPDNSTYVSSKSVVNLIHTDDDGSYTFTASDFAGIPAGANIEIVIGRGNYQIAQLGSGTKKVGIYSYSVKSIPSRFDN